MSVQILVQGKLLGIEDFLTQPPDMADEIAVGRSLWVSLLSEVIPRALLAELELARLLLGSSGGGQFLLVLPDAVRDAAEGFLGAAAKRVEAATENRVRLIWAVTENLGDWTVVRKRLQEEIERKQSAPLAGAGEVQSIFAPFAPAEAQTDLFTPEFTAGLRTASRIAWLPDLPQIIAPGEGKSSWPLSTHLSLDGITLSRHTAQDESETGPATTRELAGRAEGYKAWGVLRGDVDLFGLRLRRLQSIEEHVQVSTLYKQFFAGELEVLSMHGEFWRKTTILYSGGDDFAVYGAWDALVLFAGELEKTFHRFAEENLADFPGADAKTITMALAIAGPESSLAQVFEQAGRDLAIAKASDKDCIYLFDRIVEWKQLAIATELKDAVSRVSEEFKAAGRQFIGELKNLYGKASASAESITDHERLLRRAHRFQRRYSRVAYSKREKEFQKLRSHLIGEIVGRNIRPGAGRQLRIRPAGIVALEWARLSREV